jgi:L-alanine-DL-glutamate epimerase-like enolase superfamily enzyme
MAASSSISNNCSRVSAIDAICVALPVRRVWKWRGLEGDVGSWVIVRVEAECGVVGYGEATPLPDWGGDFNRYGGETPDTVVHIVEDLLRPVIVGLDAFDIEDMLVRMDSVVRGHVYAKAAVEMALWDIQGKITDQALYRLLGGRFRTGVLVAHMIGIMPLEEAVEEARGALEDGCRAFQVKATGDVVRDAKVVEALRSIVGEDVWLRLDANQGSRG